MTPLADALAAGPVLLDGGLATELERAGHDLSSALWSARLLSEDPDAIVAAHGAFFAAGARVATTASYQASEQGFAAVGLGAQASRSLLARSVTLAATARERAGLEGRAWVAGSVGPYGAVLADGSEYTGAYTRPGWGARAAGGLSVAELRAFHRPRLEVLAEAGADVLACETLPAAAEVEALVAELELLGVPAWLSLTTVVDEGGTARTRCGEPAADVLALARGVDTVIAVGVNCTDPTGVPAALEAARSSGVPAVAYPNDGQRWDAVGRRWTGPADLRPDAAQRWVAGGARLVGGCCRVGPELVAELGAALRAAPVRPPGTAPSG